MSLETRLRKIEQLGAADEAPRCTHRISITRDGEPVPPSRCDCDGEHINVVVCRRPMESRSHELTE